MKVTIRFDDDTVQDYVVSDEVAKKVESGDFAVLVVQHPKYNRFFKASVLEKG